MKNFKIFKGKKVLITGHTGFKGSWLTLWLLSLGAKVVGISKNIPTKPSNFKIFNLNNNKNLSNYYFDMNNKKKLSQIISKHKPHYIFHLAAQSLVRKSYIYPVETWSDNTFAILNLLEVLKKYKNKIFIILITSDKSYKNLELNRGYKENDLLGGHDPYSASKAGAEIAIQSYFHSFYHNKKNNIFLAVARAGNVIGGGDWSMDRLIPDCFKSWHSKKSVVIRSPYSTRPWQHVLEALSGYLTLAVRLKSSPKKINGQAFNFGPSLSQNYSVIDVLKQVKKNYLNARWTINQNKNFYESKLLKLNSSKAYKILNWKSKLSFNENIKLVTEWYKLFYDKKRKISMKNLSLSQINYFEKK